MEENLWGDLSDLGSVTTPTSILRDQARLLGQATSNILEGKVWSFSDRGEFIATLKIIVPTLDGYEYELLQVRYRANLYPLAIRDFANGNQLECFSEDEFRLTLQQILTSSNARRALAVLRSQAEGS